MRETTDKYIYRKVEKMTRLGLAEMIIMLGEMISFGRDDSMERTR